MTLSSSFSTTVTEMLSFRSARKEESDLLSNIAIRSKGHWGYPQHMLELWRKDLQIKPAYILDNIVRTIWLGDALVGFFAITLSRESELEHFWLLPEYIGRGCGKMAFDEICREFHRQGVKVFYIVSDPNAEGFYKHQGANRVGEIESIPQNRFLPRLKVDLS